jgi:hypothetical protein
MRTFQCRCGARLFFENTQCLNCGRQLGFLPDVLSLVPIDRKGDRDFATPCGDYRLCANYVEQGVCNWMVPAASSTTLCQACGLNHVIPDLSNAQNRALWLEVELAKRRLVYALNSLGLPVHSKREDPEHGLAFDIKADVGSSRVLTGHDDGLITLNLAEADAPERERIRLAMKERYRTMLGHFRHEIGHYYWDMLVCGKPALAEFRQLFGDETANYADALNRHYAAPAPGDYADSFISAYAAAHPWEDFAETFAHYLHLQDTLETAQAFGFAARLPQVDDFEAIITEWTKLTVAMNALNRSMGQPDAYPFAISDRVKGKLRFVHVLARTPKTNAAVSQSEGSARADMSGPPCAR